MLALLKRNIKWRNKHRLTILFTLLQPLLWLVLYSEIAKSTMTVALDINYPTYILPGLMFLVCFGTSSSCGIMNYMMKQEGSFKRLMIAPVRRESILLAQILEAILCSLFEVFVIVLISLCFGVHFVVRFIDIILIISLLFLASFLISSIAYGISLKLPNEMIYETMMNAIVLPIFFLSSALFPVHQSDGILGFIARNNPFTLCIDQVRTILLYQRIDYHLLLLTYGVFIVLCSFSFMWARRKLIQEIEV